MAADVGTLQRLPKVMGSDSLVRELCYTARKFPAPEALSSGFMSKVFENKDQLVFHIFSFSITLVLKIILFTDCYLAPLIWQQK